MKKNSRVGLGKLGLVGLFGTEYYDLMSMGDILDRKIENRKDVMFDSNTFVIRGFLNWIWPDDGTIRDEHSHISIDGFEDAKLSVWPLSYKFNLKYIRSLDRENIIKLDHVPHSGTLRELLIARCGEYKERLPLPTREYNVPCKLGMSALIRVRGTNKYVFTRQSKSVIKNKGKLHGSFSGGVDVLDFQGVETLRGAVENAAIRECKEELRLEISRNSIKSISIYYEYDRMALQSFVVAEVDAIDLKRLTKSEEVAAIYITSLFGLTLRKRLCFFEASEELDFFIKSGAIAG